jgi:hypothetical protein
VQQVLAVLAGARRTSRPHQRLHGGFLKPGRNKLSIDMNQGDCFSDRKRFITFIPSAPTCVEHPFKFRADLRRQRQRPASFRKLSASQLSVRFGELLAGFIVLHVASMSRQLARGMKYHLKTQAKSAQHMQHGKGPSRGALNDLTACK